MVKLTPNSACDELLPVTVGKVTAREVDAGVLTSLAPYKGMDSALSSALNGAHGLELPKPNRITGNETAQALWFGQRIVLLMGPAPDASLAQYAALTDQSDAWAVVRLDGFGARDVLARLTPIDLRPDHFRPGDTARTDLQHMMASITCIGAQAYQIMVFRAFAETLVHELRVAMETVASRQARK